MTPSNTLDVSGNVGLIGSLTIDQRSDDSGLIINRSEEDVDITSSSGSNNLVLSVGNTSNNMIFETGGSERVRIDNVGNVGIGTDSPNASYKLDVDGSVNIVNNLDVSGGVNVHNNLVLGGDLTVNGNDINMGNGATIVNTTGDRLVVTESVVELAGDVSINSNLDIVGDINSVVNIDGTGELTMGTINMTGFSVNSSGDTEVLDLSVNGNNITMGNGATIVNTDSTTLTITEENVVLSGDLTVNGNDITMGNGATIVNTDTSTLTITEANVVLSGDLTMGNGTTIINTDLSINTITMTDFEVDADGNVITKSIDNNNGGITNAGAISGVTSLTTSGDLTVDTDTLVVDSTDNVVGIGTSVDADYKLKVDGSSNITGVLKLGTIDNLQNYVQDISADLDNLSQNQLVDTNNSDTTLTLLDNSMSLVLDGTERFAIDTTNGGTIYAGVTTLQVGPDTDRALYKKNELTLRDHFSILCDDANPKKSYIDTNDGPLYFTTNSQADVNMVIYSGGDVSFANDVYVDGSLTVEGDISGTAYRSDKVLTNNFTLDTNNKYVGLFNGPGTDSNYQTLGTVNGLIYNPDLGKIFFKTIGVPNAATNIDICGGGFAVDTDTLYVDDNNHNVGIGTDSPDQSYKLDVSGSVKIGFYDNNSGNDHDLVLVTNGTGTGLDTDTDQFAIIDNESSNTMSLKFGVNTSNQYSYIQCTRQDSAHAALKLNPKGGSVETGNNLTVGGDLTVTGNDINFGNGATIVNTSNSLLTITEATTAFSGAITTTGNATVGGDLTVDDGAVIFTDETTDPSVNGIDVLTLRTTNNVDVVAGNGPNLVFATNRGLGSSASNSAKIKGYIYSGVGTGQDYHAMDRDVYGDNNSLHKGITIQSVNGNADTDATYYGADTTVHGNLDVGGDLIVTGDLSCTTINLSLDTTDDERPILFADGDQGRRSFHTGGDSFTFNPSTDSLTVGLPHATGAASIYIEGHENSGYNSALYFGTRNSSFVSQGIISQPKAAIIAESANYGFSRSKLHFCMEGTNNNSSSYIASTSNSRMCIDYDGNVGIGTTSPGYRLDVDGSANIDSDLNVGGKISIDKFLTINLTHSHVGYDHALFLICKYEDGHTIIGNLYGNISESDQQYRAATYWFELLINTNSQSGGHSQETASLISKCISSKPRTLNLVTCDYQNETYFAIQNTCNGDSNEIPEILYFNGYMLGDYVMEWVDNSNNSDVANVTILADKEDTQDYEFHNIDVTIHDGNMEVDGNITFTGTLYDSNGEFSSGSTFFNEDSTGTTISYSGTVQATNFVATSDERKKKNIQALESPLEKIMKLQGRNYTWNDSCADGLVGKKSSGFIAQEVEKIIPEVVMTRPPVDKDILEKNKDTTGDDGDEGDCDDDKKEIPELKGIDYNGLVPYLVECIKELKTELDTTREILKANNMELYENKREISALNEKLQKSHIIKMK